MTKPLVLVAGLAAAVVALSWSPQRRAPKIYVNSEFHYALAIPEKWRISEGDVPVILNFKPSEGGPQGLFPDHGAEIYVVPLAAVQIVVGAKTIDEWISRNITPAHSSISIKHLSDPVPGEDGPREVIEVEADFERDPQDEGLQHETDYYFKLRGAPFRLRLLFWKDDPRSANYRSVSKSVLRSIHGTP